MTQSPQMFFQHISASAGFFFVAVVGELYAENDDTGYGGDGVCDDQRPVVDHYSLHYKENNSEPEKEERGHGYAVGVTCADGVDGLREIAAYHTYSGCVAYDVDKQWIHICERFWDLYLSVQRHKGPECSVSDVTGCIEQSGRR